MRVWERSFLQSCKELFESCLLSRFLSMSQHNMEEEEERAGCRTCRNWLEACGNWLPHRYRVVTSYN